MKSNFIHKKRVNPHYLNRRCYDCGWKTFSYLSLGYKYCPMCGSTLEEYDMRNESRT